MEDRAKKRSRGAPKPKRPRFEPYKPKRLSSFDNCEAYVGPEALRRVPESTSSIALRLVTKWAHVEIWKARLLTRFIKGDVRLVAGILLECRGDSAIHTALKLALPDSDADLAKSILGGIATASGPRNQIAHGLLGYAAQHDPFRGDPLPENVLISVSTDDLAASHVADRALLDELDQETTGAPSDEWREAFIAQLLDRTDPDAGHVGVNPADAVVWTRRDLKGQCGVADVAAFEMRLLWRLVGGGDGADRARSILERRLLDEQQRYLVARETGVAPPPILELPPEDQPPLPGDVL